MKLEVSNPNYAATIVRIPKLNALQGLDRLRGVDVFGCQALVGIDTNINELHVAFTSETQLSSDLCKNNNLFRHKELNVNTDIAGYLEDNRRVKAIKFRGNISSALLLPISSLSSLGIDVSGLKAGDTFTSIDGIEVCKKFVVHHQRSKTSKQGNPKRDVYGKFFPKHFDTENFWKNSHLIPDKSEVIVTQKLHGTSARFGNVRVERELNIVERLLGWLGYPINKTEYISVSGTRNTVRNNRDDFGFYESDVWSFHNEKIKDLIPKDWVVYGEIIGFASQKAIQNKYTYDCQPGESKLYVYRITFLNSDGVGVDLSWDAVKLWCEEHGLNHVPEIGRCRIGITEIEHVHNYVRLFMDMKLADELGCPNLVTLCPESVCDEGVCVRVDRVYKPLILKAKSPKFLEYETKQLDSGESNEEDQDDQDEVTEMEGVQ